MHISGAVNGVLHLFGCHISRIQKQKHHKHTAGQYWNTQPVKALGLEVGTAIDVGAGYGTPPLLEAFPHAFLLLIEPLEECKPAMEKILTNRQGELVDCAVGAEPGETRLFVDNRKIIKSSVLERTDSPHTSERRISVQTLDGIVSERELPKPYALKIDVEGAEYDVLVGAQNILKDTVLVVIEVNLDARYQSIEDNLCKVDSLLHACGLSMQSILDASIDHETRVVKKADFLYVRRAGEGEKLDESVRSGSGKR